MSLEKTNQLNNYTPNLGTATKIKPLSSQELAQIIAQAADDRKADDIVLLKVAEVSYLTDYFVIATGFSKTQVRAIADSIEKQLKEQYQIQPQHIEGKSEANWILQDYGEVIVHLFLPAEREFYNIEAFWGHAEKINFNQH